MPWILLNIVAAFSVHQNASGGASVMKLVLSIVFLFMGALSLFPGCGKPASRDQVIDPELRPYVDRFYSEAAARGVTSFPLQLGNVTLKPKDPAPAEPAPSPQPSPAPSPSSVPAVPVTEPSGLLSRAGVDWHAVGTCYYGSNDIVIDRKFFDSATEVEREMILFHEMGHCVLGLQHASGSEEALLSVNGQDIFPVQADSSMMVPFQSGVAYQGYRAQYLDALFHGGANVDFLNAFPEVFPGAFHKLQGDMGKLEAVINQVAGQIDYPKHIRVEASKGACALTEDVFAIPYARLWQGESLFFEKFEKNIIDEKTVKALDNNIRKKCVAEKDPVLCRFKKPDPDGYASNSS